MAFYVYSANADIQIATPLEKGPKTEQGNNLTQDFLDLHLLASDTIDGKFTAIVVETVTCVPNVGCY